jgi:hypothetical protein
MELKLCRICNNVLVDQNRTTCSYVCNEKLIVAVHHFVGNKINNNPENLVPLCPTHHIYIHSKYKNLIIDVVVKYIENFKSIFERKI